MIEPIPLTLSQYRILLESKLRPHSIEYNNILFFRINGDLNIDKLRSVINGIECQYSELRAYIVENEGEYFQKIHEPNDYSLPVIDLSKQNGDKSKLLDKVLATIFFKGFNLYCYPLYRYILVKINSEEYIFGLSWHHLIVDAIAVYQILQYIEFEYNNSSTKSINKNNTPNSLKLAFDFENQYRGSDEYSIDRDYWLSKLIQINYPRQPLVTSIKNNKGKRIVYHLTKPFTESLIARNEKLKCSLFILIAAAIITYHFKKYRLPHYCLPYSINTRDHSIKNSIGYFVNTLPLVGSLESTWTYEDLIIELKKQRHLDKQAQRVALLDVISYSRDKVNLNFRELLSTSLNQFTYLSFKLDFVECHTEPVPLTDIEISTGLIIRYDLMDSLFFEIDYHSEIYTEFHINQLIQHLNFELKNIAFNSHRSLVNE